MVSKNYGIAYWYLKNKFLLKKILKYFVYFCISLIWFYFFIQLFIYLFNIGETDKIIEELGSKNIVNYDSTEKAQAIKVLESGLLLKGVNQYDVYAKLENSNNYWMAKEITYQFNVPGASLPARTTYLFPGKTKIITEINIPVASSAGTKQASLQILEVKWKGLREKVPEDRIDFIDSDYKIIESTENEAYTRLSTTALNNNIYGFRNLKVTVLLISQGKIAGVNVSHINNFLSGQSKDLEFIWPRKFTFNSEIQFDVETDLIDENNILLNAN